MRIGAYNQVAQVYGHQSVKNNCNTGRIDATSTLDQVSFSTVGKDMQIAKNALASVPDIRQGRVNELRASNANGTYQVSAESFADKLLASFDERFF